MLTPVEVFVDWLRLSKLRPRFHPIPAEIAGPFIWQIQRFDFRKQDLHGMYLPNRDIDIHMDFIDDGRCNAFAGVYKGIGLIGFNKGAMLLTIEMFYRMLSHPKVWSAAGNSKIEKFGAMHREGMPTNYDTLESIRKKAYRRLFPKPPTDDIRRRVADFCIEIVWGFLILHETVHIAHGHIEYLQDKNNVSVIPAILQASQSNSPLSIHDKDYQSLELWSDLKAVEVQLRGMLLKNENPQFDAIFPRPEQRIFLWAFSVYSLFRLWGLSVDPDDLQGHNHPPTLIRYELMLSAAHMEIDKEFPELSDKFLEIVMSAQMEVEDGFASCGGERLAKEDVMDRRHPKVDDHCNALLDHHENVLVSSLQKYTHLPLHNPNVPVLVT